MFLRYRSHHLQPPRIKNFYCISSIHIEKSSTHREVSLGRPSFAAILFVEWLVRILKVKNFSGNYSVMYRFIAFHSKSSPTSFSKKKVPEKHIINFFGLTWCVRNTRSMTISAEGFKNFLKNPNKNILDQNKLNKTFIVC